MNNFFCFEVLPKIGIGPVKLGMNRETSRKAMNREFNVYKKTEDSLMTTDAYLDNSFQIFFNTNNKVAFIEVSYNPKLYALFLYDINLFETEGEKLIQELNKLTPFDKEDSEIPYGYFFS